jgi:hypothetical protein
MMFQQEISSKKSKGTEPMHLIEIYLNGQKRFTKVKPNFLDVLRTKGTSFTRHHRSADDRDMAEITSPDYPVGRLVVCKNPLLAEERGHRQLGGHVEGLRGRVRVSSRVE